MSQELIKHGKVVRGWLGVSLQGITPELAKSFKLKSFKGSLVADVMKDSPAYSAGIRRGDVITAFQGKPVDNPSLLRNDVSLIAPGTKITLTIERDGTQKDISVTVGNLASQEAAIENTLKNEFGLTVRSLTANDANKYGLSSQVGVVVLDVLHDSTFWRAGFQKGDIILQVDNNEVDGPATLLQVLRAALGRTVNVLALDHTSGQKTYVQVHLR
ncbi:MAG: PDZ domain-containing protein [Syntrophobacteraceae bacterium]